MTKFNDFIKILDEDTLASLYQRSASMSDDMGSIEISTNSTDLVNYINRASLLNALSLVELYHEWMEEQNELTP